MSVPGEVKPSDKPALAVRERLFTNLCEENEERGWRTVVLLGIFQTAYISVTRTCSGFSNCTSLEGMDLVNKPTDYKLW